MRRSKTRIVPKDAEAAADALSNVGYFAMQARRSMDSAADAIGNSSRWAGEMTRIRQMLLKSQLYAEDILDEIYEQRRAEKRRR